MRYYLKTTDSRYIEPWKQLEEMSNAQWKFLRDKARSWGFDEIGREEFGYRCDFFKLCGEDEPRHPAPEIEGFKFDRKNGFTRHEGKLYRRYSFHGRNKLATALQKELDDGMPPMPKELSNFFVRRSIGMAFCAKFGLPTEHFSGTSILYSTGALLLGDILILSLPVTDDEVLIPEGFEEITERAWGAEIAKHNAAVAANKEAASEGAEA